MATTNKALTTYLPTESVEWLEKYCLDYKHLLNKEGNPKLGTALADIISRLADGELTLPPKIEPTSTVVDNVTYSTEISGLKGEIEELRKVVKEYSTSNVPSTLPDDSLRGEVEALGKLVTELETYTQNQFKAVREELKATHDRTVTATDSIATPTATPAATGKDSTTKSWGEFFRMVNIDALTATEAQKKENIDTRTQQAKEGIDRALEMGLGEWAVKVAGRSFVQVGV
jgi:hypothetical protein